MSSAPSIRPWRTAFLTLRDETLTSPPPHAVLDLLRDLLLVPHSLDALVSAAPHLPSHEVTADLVLLVELSSAVSDCAGAGDVFVRVCRVVHDISCKVRLEVNSSFFTVTLDFLNKMVDCLLGEVDARELFISEPAGLESIIEIVGILRFFVKVYGKNSSSSESTKLVGLLLHLISCLPMDLLTSSHSNVPCWNTADIGIRNSKCQTLLDVQLFAFTVIGDTLMRMGSSVSVELWQSTLDVLRKVLGIVASKNFLLEGHAMSRFYAALLHCLHLVLSDPKGSLSEHVAGFVAALQMFFMYGLPCRSALNPATSGFKEKTSSSSSLKSGLLVSSKSVDGPYKPPHLRKKEGCSPHIPIAQRSTENVAFRCGFSSSDSEHSDTDGFPKDEDHFRSSKARIAAILCIQDLCQADPKALASLWTMILPTNDVLQSRKNQATIMTSLLFDHVMKARIASVSALASILTGHSSIFLQVAEHKESSKCGSFTTLSSSLGQMLMQLHRGLLYLVQYETHNGLVPSLFKVLTLLVSATPYARMPVDLLPTIITSLRIRISEVIASTSDQNDVLPCAFNCIRSTFSTSPPSLHVLKLLEGELSPGEILTQECSSILQVLIEYSQPNANAIVRVEALQALRAALHNYPSIVNALWEQISASVLGSLKMCISNGPGDEALACTSRGDNKNTLGLCNDKCPIAAIKVLDESLRASSGFKGMDDLFEGRSLDSQSRPDSTRRKLISCAPSYEFDGLKTSDGSSTEFSNGFRHWSEVIEKHLPLTLVHRSPQIRAASVTCFAGMTSSVFLSLTDAGQNFTISSIIAAALNDEVPSVRSAACRALGVIACFPQIFSSVRVLNEFIHAADLNTHDPLVSVRITSSWALANICDSLRYRATDINLQIFGDQRVDTTSISLLIESALRLARDGDKVKSNAVRALGNLSRFVDFTEHSTSSNSPRASHSGPHWLEKMVQAFVSCVTTGNVKVQWNVCHALGNLFLNDTLKLRDMSWASSVYTILLLLLRDSTNFKIRINAAAALAVPASRFDYGDSFSNVIQGLELVLESLSSNQFSMPSNIKYKDTLEKQLTLTTLHVLGFASSGDEEILKGFLVKKSLFLEEWIKSLSSFFSTSHDKPVQEANLEVNQGDELAPFELKKTMILKAVNSLIGVYKCSSSPRIALRFEKLLDSFS